MRVDRRDAAVALGQALRLDDAVYRSSPAEPRDRADQDQQRHADDAGAGDAPQRRGRDRDAEVGCEAVSPREAARSVAT